MTNRGVSHIMQSIRHSVEGNKYAAQGPFQRDAGWCEAAGVRRGNTSRSCPLNCEGIRGVSGAPVIARGASAPVEAVFVRRRQTRGGTAKFRPLLVGAEGFSLSFGENEKPFLIYFLLRENKTFAPPFFSFSFRRKKRIAAPGEEKERDDQRTFRSVLWTLPLDQGPCPWIPRRMEFEECPMIRVRYNTY